MAHDFANAYGNVKTAVEGLVAADPLRVSLNRASAQFHLIQDSDFDKAPGLRAEFRALRVRLRRNPHDKESKAVRYLDNTDSDGMVLLAKSLIAFAEKMDAPEFDDIMNRNKRTEGSSSLIRDPGPDDWDLEGDLD